MTPAWQTDELGEEWVESSPSPPATPAEPPAPAPASYDQASVNAKRGSLRALGHAAARSLPARKNPAEIPYSRYGSNPFVRSASGIPSPPTSHSSSEGDCDEAPVGEHVQPDEAADAAVGTFVVKDGEEERGKAFPRNPFTPGSKGAKEIFGQLALERLFQPPSPPTGAPQESASAAADLEPATPARDSSSPSQPPATSTTPTEPRRASHAYAPANPSRLSKSVTPSSNESFSSDSASRASAPVQPVGDVSSERDETEVADNSADWGLPHHELVADMSLIDDTHERTEHTLLRSGEFETDLSPIARADYPFTFNAPVGAGSSRARRPIRSGVFEPTLAPLANGQPSHSTLVTSQTRQNRTSATANPALRLFRSTYDTVTREHLSALVDSIAIEASPSPPHSFGSSPTDRRQQLRQWSSSDPGSAASGSAGSARGSSETPSSDGRSSKRLRLTPPEAKRNSRDWKAHGIALMDRMRAAEMSGTSASASNSPSSGEQSNRAESVDWNDLPPTPPLVVPRQQLPRRQPPSSQHSGQQGQASGEAQHHSNPSTASSNYIREAERVMAYLKTRVVSDTASGADTSPVVPGRRALSALSDNVATSASESDLGEHAKPRSVPSPRRMLRRLSMSETIKQAAEASSGSDDDAAPAAPPPVTVSRPNSRSSVQSVGSGPPPSAPTTFNPDDLNRFISSSTVATATTAVSTSFVKHAGPRAAAGGTHGGALRMIRPGDVHGVVPDRIGNMLFDRTKNQWVRAGPRGLDMVDEAGESRAGGSEESVDVFAGIDSLGAEERSRSARLLAAAEQASPAAASTQESLRPDMPPRAAPEAPASGQQAAAAASPLICAQQTDAAPATTPAARPLFTHTVSAPELHTPGLQTPGAGPSNPLRSALRNPNSLTPASAIKKRAAWHEDVTPRANDSGERRSVSFSDRQDRPIRGSVDGNDLFSERGDGDRSASFLPSANTNRIQGMLHRLEDLSLDGHDDMDKTPSKPSKLDVPVPALAESVSMRPSYPPSPTSSDDTIPLPTRSFRSRNRSRVSLGGSGAANQTFLTDCSFGVAHDRLVQLITDVQPWEPYWEQLTAIDLSNKGVETLARLKEFLPVLDEAKLNDNAIDYLSGIPSTVRTLHVAGNRLTSLTSVNHLRNMQFLDISRNQLDSVTQLECLKHLRELRADGNSIADISGIMGMDCLVKLSVSGNEIARVDLTKAKWGKLESLNLSHNKITDLVGVDALTAVNMLNLDDNCLTSFRPKTPMTALRVLRLSDNDIDVVDLSRFPRVRTFFADGNRVQRLNRSSGNGGKHIENLSLRNQRVKGLQLGAEDLQNVKRLYLSGNPLTHDFWPTTALYALTYLELAACNMSRWPALATLAPNLRVVNVNFNFMENLNGLAGLTRLRKLMAVGMRIGGGEAGSVRGLKELTSLEEVDLRMNPATLSFYLPVVMPTDQRRTAANGDQALACEGAAALDAHFRRALPDEWYSRRLVYRGLIMAACPRVRMLDGIAVGGAERKKAQRLLAMASGE